MTELHTPEVTTKLGIDLPQDVHVDSVLEAIGIPRGHELRNDRIVRIDDVLERNIESLFLCTFWDYHHEALHSVIGLLCGLGRRIIVHVFLKVGPDGILKVIYC